jgi:hypothetical protein
MNVLDSYNKSVFTTSQEDFDRVKEEFAITGINVVNNKFSITAHNTGNLPVHITRFWVENTTDVNKVFKYEVDKKIAPGATLTQIGQDIPLSVISTQGYDIKLATERGNVKEIYVNSANSKPLDLKLFALPGTVPTGFTTTLLFAVTNNMSNNGVLTNITPNIVVTPQGANPVLVSGPTPTSYPVLERGDTAYFEWTYTLTGDDGDGADFQTSIQNGYPGNSISKTVNIDTIQIADESQTSLTAAGLSILKTPDNVLVLHKETTDALGGRQMYSVTADNNVGEIIQLDTTSPIFYTNNDTVTINIPSGIWNASLRYLSNAVPDSLIGKGESMIFHFEDAASSSIAKDSTGVSTNDLTLASSGSKPTKTTGPHGSSALSFNGVQYAYDDINSNNDIESTSTTAGWFKTSSSARQVILRMGDQGDSNEFYEMGLNNGKAWFRFSSKAGTIDGDCQTTGTYNNGAWHHFVAVKTGTSTCTLYMDGIQSATDSTTCGTCNDLSPIGKWNIGRDPSSSGINYFVGDLDDIMHWDNYLASSTDATNLFSTNYGNAAHKITFTIDKVDQNGNTPTNIFTSTGYGLKFIDGFGGYGAPSDSIWGQSNFTINVPSNIQLNSNERLKFKMTFVPQTYGELNMKLKTDDTDIPGLTGNSYLQVPSPDSPFPGYYTYDNDATGIVNVYNSGPNGAWLTFDSRIAFETISGNAAFGSWVCGFDTHPFSTGQDSEFFSVGEIQQVCFSRPSDHPNDGSPGNQDGNIIPPGRYRMYVHLNGYDQKGSFFLGTQYVGIVRVI